MYNIHSHYENILAYANSIVTQPTVIYLHPFGSTQPENIEALQNGGFGPLIIAYDQEPLNYEYNFQLFDYINRNFKDDNGNRRPTILLTTEKNSLEKNKILQKFGYKDVNYFFHGLAAADWYRGYQYCTGIIPPSKRKLKKKYITFNRVTGNSRSYRSFLIAELAKHELLDQGYISYSEVCPVHGFYEENILDAISKYNVSAEYVLGARYFLDKIKFPLRIDCDGIIPNDSQTIGPINLLMESFLYVVTETCYWETKTHLTEKIFKPIVAKQPFVLLGCTNNLKYLRSYGFKTFNQWWDESYDEIEDPIQRLQAVIKIINNICSMSNEDLTAMLHAMQSVLDYNYNRFFSKNFIDSCWNEMAGNLEQSLVQQSPQTLKEN
jgi:hypothetical protein